MKKQLALILAAVLAFGSITGCGAADTKQAEPTAKAETEVKSEAPAAAEKSEAVVEEEKEEVIALADASDIEEEADEAEDSKAMPNKALDYDNMTPEDLVAMISDPSNPTLDEYCWLLSTIQYVPIDDNLEVPYKNITNEAIKIVKDDVKAAGNKLPDSKDIFYKLIDSEAPQVRAHALTYLFSLFGVDGDGLKVCSDLIDNEKDPFVIKQLIATLANEGGKDPKIGAFLIEKSTDENDAIRRQACMALANPWSENVEGVVDAVVRLINDPNPDIASYARKNAGRIHDEAVIEPLAAVLADMSQAKSHGDAVSGLCYLWFDYPFHAQTSEKAYNVTVDYWKNVERTEDTPYWTAVGAIKNKSDKNFEPWKEKATYFNQDEIVEIMKELTLCPDASWLARCGALDNVFAYADPDYCRNLRADIEALTDSKAVQLLEAYNKKLNKMEEDLSKQ